jgi:hypothetical protein
LSALNEHEKVKVRHHLGYLNVQEAPTFVLGVPGAVETQYTIEGAMNRILEEAVPEVRRHIQILDSIEEQSIANHELLQITRIDTIDVNSTGEHREQRQLRQVYNSWVDSLANLLGTTRNPFDQRLKHFGLGGINARVG